MTGSFGGCVRYYGHATGSVRKAVKCTCIKQIFYIQEYGLEYINEFFKTGYQHIHKYYKI